MPRRRPRPRGAPRGNLNAFKNGAHSPRYMALMRVLLRIPLVRDIVLREAARRRGRLAPAARRRVRETQRDTIERLLGPDLGP